MDKEFRRTAVRREVRALFVPLFPPATLRVIVRRADHASFVRPVPVSFRVIEDNTVKSCPDLLVECIAVGNRRSSPALLIELNPGAPALGDADSVRREVYRRIRHFQSRRLAHERVGSVELIVIVQRSSWPRTPVGHILRADAERKFQRELDRAYAAASAR